MQQVNLDSQVKITAVFSGKEYSLKKPTVGQIRAFEKAFGEDSNGGKVDRMVSLLAQCGLPEEVVDALDMDGLETLTNALMPKKKV